MHGRLNAAYGPQRVQVPNISGFWSQIPLRVWLLDPNTIKSMVFGTRDLKYWVLGPSGTRSEEPMALDAGLDLCTTWRLLRSSFLVMT